MTLWTMEQVEQVRGLWAKALVDEAVLVRGGDAAVDAIREKLAKRIQDDAHAFAVEVDASDLEYLVTDALPWSRALMCRWHPTTNAAVLVGGPRDGERWAIQKIGESFHLDVLEETPWFESEAGPEMAVGVRTVTYDLAGWSESDRCWVYKVSSR